METTPDHKLANMTWAVVSYDATAGAALTPPKGIQVVVRVADPASKKRVVSKTDEKLAEPPEDAHMAIARIPVLVNHKAMKKDDVLLVFKEEHKRKQSSEVAGPSQLAKIMRPENGNTGR